MGIRLKRNGDKINKTDYDYFDTSAKNINNAINELMNDTSSMLMTSTLEKFDQVKRLIAIYMVQNCPINKWWDTDIDFMDNIKQLMTILGNSMIKMKQIPYRRWGEIILEKIDSWHTMNELYESLKSIALSKNEPNLDMGDSEGRDDLGGCAGRFFYHLIEDAKEIMNSKKEKQKRLKEEKKRLDMMQDWQNKVRARGYKKKTKIKYKKKTGPTSKKIAKKKLLMTFAENPSSGVRIQLDVFAEKMNRKERTIKQIMKTFNIAYATNQLKLGNLISTCRMYSSNTKKFNDYLKTSGYDEKLLENAKNLKVDQCSETERRNMELSAAKLATMKSNYNKDEVFGLLKADFYFAQLEAKDLEGDTIKEIMDDLNIKYQYSCLINSYYELVKISGTPPIVENVDDILSVDNELRDSEQDNDIPLHPIQDPKERKKQPYYCFYNRDTTMKLFDLLECLISDWHDNKSIYQNIPGLTNNNDTIEKHFENLNSVIKCVIKYGDDIKNSVTYDNYGRILKSQKTEFDEFVDTYRAIQKKQLKDANMDTYEAAVKAVKKWKKIKKKENKNEKDDENKTDFESLKKEVQESPNYNIGDLNSKDITETHNLATEIMKEINRLEQQKKQAVKQNQNKPNQIQFPYFSTYKY